MQIEVKNFDDIAEQIRSYWRSMRSHRSKQLDSLLGKQVVIVWSNAMRDNPGGQDKGILHWGGDYPNVKSGMYYLALEGMGGISFRKSHVKIILPLGNRWKFIPYADL